jgi:transcription elongation factor GreA
VAQRSDSQLASLTLGEALQEYLDSLKPEFRNTHGGYVRKYVEFAGENTWISTLSGSRVESFAESQIHPSDPSAQERVAALKAWFQFLKKHNYTDANFGVHIRVRRASGRAKGGRRATQSMTSQAVEMTAEGYEALQRELQELTNKQPEIRQAIATAREDKDFRENAPLDAAREALAFNEQRRKEIEAALKRAVIAERGGTDVTTVSATVDVTRLDNDTTATYILVGPREADAAQRKISVESPVGKQLLGRRVGDEVEVTVPSGVITYRIDAIRHE